MVTWDEYVDINKKGVIHELLNNQGREYKIIDVYNKLEPILISDMANHVVPTPEIIKAFREMYEAGKEAKTAELKE